jgi:plastocyanin
MSKLIALLLALPLLLGTLPATGDEAALAEPVQTTPGTVRVPTRFTDPEQGYPGLGRRLWLAASASNGVVAHVLDVDPATWGGAFELGGVTDATGAGDLGIYFYKDFGGLEPLSGPHNAVSTAEYDTRAVGGEKGFIPFGTKKALVFTYNGVNAAFTYKGFAMPTINLAGGSLDMTIPAGGYVGWLNNTGAYSFVRHTATAPEFDSSPGVATGLRNGEVFSHQFLETGTYKYTTSTGSGTITVVDGPGPGTPAG